MAVEQETVVQLASRPAIAAGASVTGTFGHQWLRVSFWCAAIALGAMDAWSSRFTMNPDGVSYLDLGDAWWRADWHVAINGCWSPLYSWVLGLFLKVMKPSASSEYPVVHLANFLIYVATLGCFEFLLCSFIRYRRESAKSLVNEGYVALPEWAWWTLGYSLFIWMSVVLITIKMVTPDMCVAASVYLAAGLILRIRNGPREWRTFVLLGVVLGFGYLAKAAMFPLSFVFLAVGLLSFGNVRKAASRILVSTTIFLSVAAPLIVALSWAKGHATFSDSGRLNYEIFIDAVDPWFPNSAALRHPARKIFEAPAAYEFAEPIEGTYPPWYDPTYWHEGIEPRFNLRAEVRAITFALLVCGSIFFSPFMQLNVLTGLIALYLLAPRPSLCVKRTAMNWPLLIPALSAFGLYALVYTEYRYIAEFVLLLWLAAFSGVRLPASDGSRRLIATVILAVAATTGVSVVGKTVRNLASTRKADSVYWKATTALEEQGIKPGDKVALIWDEEWGTGALGGTFVLRLARIRAVAEVPRPNSFWMAGPSTQSRIIQALARTGAKAILAWGDHSPSASSGCWKRLRDTPYCVCLVDGGGR